MVHNYDSSKALRQKIKGPQIYTPPLLTIPFSSPSFQISSLHFSDHLFLVGDTVLADSLNFTIN